ncbi:hypothetical protein [Bradyrhizobium sp. Ec3.3]|uniref:hypothetical protein n=1 Tax=Bradyrhizobium sp. Ec3.3 TaxID=189753 RepID=UPI0012EC94CF|nr:hypothetical protein [Bradyrhizobium sp. Ec3.3]
MAAEQSWPAAPGDRERVSGIQDTRSQTSNTCVALAFPRVVFVGEAASIAKAGSAVSTTQHIWKEFD